MRRNLSPLLPILCAALVAGCAAATSRAEIEGTGANPPLVKPNRPLVPTVNVAKAIGWPEGTTPTAHDGATVTPFARDLDHPRWLYVLPNGDVIVAETNAPPRPENNKGIKGWFITHFMKKAGGTVPSANRLTLLRDTNADGVAELKTVFMSGLNSPFGIALAGNRLYVANTDAIVSVPYTRGDTSIKAKPVTLTELPGGPLNHHWTKTLLASADGSTLYVGVGSNSNVAENGIEAERDRAAIWAVDTKTGAHKVYASGLRNPVGMAWEPTTKKLWVTVNERDELGNDLVPDYMTSVREGGFYGWPYSYYGKNVDTRVKPQRPDLVEQAIVPDFALGPHTASLGLAYSRGSAASASFGEGMFVGQHGSWNRKPRSGYKVVFVPFKQGRPSGEPIDILTGFVDDDKNQAFGRPVGVAIDSRGALLVADDVGNAIWRVRASVTSARK